MGRRLLVERTGRHFRGKIAVEDLFDVLPDVERIEHLHVGKSVEKNDALDDLVRVLHFLDRLLAPLLGERLVAPVIQQSIMQPILVDGRELVAQSLVQVVKDSWIASHDRAPALSPLRVGRLLIRMIITWFLRGERYDGTSPVSFVTLGKNQEPDWPCWQHGDSAAISASSMIRRMVRAQRPHWALQPRQ